MKNYLNFETSIKEIETELEKLKDPYNQGGLAEVDTQKISKTQKKIIWFLTLANVSIFLTFSFQLDKIVSLP